MKKFNSYETFNDYLKNLTEKKPFDCSFLRVLPEEVTTSEGNKFYEQGALICSKSPGHIKEWYQNHRCHLASGSALILDENGNLEMKCAWNFSTFKLAIKDFSPTPLTSLLNASKKAL